VGEGPPRRAGCEGSRRREFKNVKLDSCGSCKGVWFDAGELEMIILLKRGDQAAVISGLAK
jgi:Zn-finger nucleic acid-binding protein